MSDSFADETDLHANENQGANLAQNNGGVHPISQGDLPSAGPLRRTLACMGTAISIGCEQGGPEGGFIAQLKVPLYQTLSRHVTSTHCAAIDMYSLVLRVDGGGTTQPVVIDGVQVATLKNGGFLRRELPPGRHMVVVQGPQPTGVEVDIEPGKTLFFRYAIEHTGSKHHFGSLAFTHTFVRTLDAIPPDIALLELRETKALD